MKQTLIGREQEIRQLQEYLSSEKSEFIAIYGRRRVGKTFFVRQVVGNEACLVMTGMENVDLNDQLANFYFTLRRVWPSAAQPHSWLEAFDQLQNYIESLPSGRKIIFID